MQGGDEGVTDRVSEVFGPCPGVAVAAQYAGDRQCDEHHRCRDGDGECRGTGGFTHERNGALPGQGQARETHDHCVPAGEQVLQ